MKANVEQVAAWVAKHEGGYAERPEEGGGAVNMGVTFTTFQHWRKKTKGQIGLTWADLKAMTHEEAQAIYAAEFFPKVYFDDLPSGLDYAVYDTSVMSGVSGALTILQEALGFPHTDRGRDFARVTGKWDKFTAWAVKNRPMPGFIDTLLDWRLNKYRNYPTFKKVAVKKTGKTWGKIWTERIAEVRHRCHQLHGAK